MKGFGIYVKNDLLDPKHLKAFGTSSLWLYLWLLDHMTSISEDGVGSVLGGKPITYSEIEKELGLSHRSYTRYMGILRTGGYINTTKTMRGVIISVNKASKIFGNATPKVAKRATPKVSERVANVARLSSQSGEANKTIQLDNTKTIQTTTKVVEPKGFGREDINKVISYWEEVCGYPIAGQKNRYAAKNILAKHGMENTTKLIRMVSEAQSDKYAPTIGDLADLQQKMGQLAAYTKKRISTNERIVKL